MIGITFYEEDREPTPDKPNEIICGMADKNAEIYIRRLEQENKQLKEDKKKAIEYIKTHKDARRYYHPDGTFETYRVFVEGYHELLEILGDKE